MSDDRPLPKPPRPEVAHSPRVGGDVPTWQIALVYAVIIGAAFVIAMVAAR